MDSIAYALSKINIFLTASLFSVMALYAERSLAIQPHLRYQDLVIYKRVIIAVISIWVFSTLTSLLKLWIPKNIMFVFLLLKILLQHRYPLKLLDGFSTSRIAILEYFATETEQEHSPACVLSTFASTGGCDKAAPFNGKMVGQGYR